MKGDLPDACAERAAMSKMLRESTRRTPLVAVTTASFDLVCVVVLFRLRALEARKAVPHSRTSMELKPATKRLNSRIACPLRPVIVEHIKLAIVHNTMLFAVVGV